MTNPTMLMKLESFKTSAIAHFGADTDFIYTQNELLEIRDAQNAPIPGIIWSKGNIAFTTNRKLPAPARMVKKMFDLNIAADPATKAVERPTPVAQIATPAPAPAVFNAVATAVTESVVANKVIAHTTQSLVPTKITEYVPFGNFHTVFKIIKSGKFFPTLITGLAGNGKTMMIEQASAKAKREFIRTNITIESDEDSLIGGFRLVNGETVWQDGPVIEAMIKGAVLLLDEVDLGGDKIMCLQSILEGKGYFVKKTGRMIVPAKGFQIFLTGNTKGKGNESGKFVGTRVLNEAMLDRIKACLVQEYPNRAQEVKILTLALAKECNDVGETATTDDAEFVERLTDWAQATRQAYFDESVDDLISTRRAACILESYMVFGRDRMLAIKTGVSRFNDEEIESFTSFYEAIDERANEAAINSAEDVNADAEFDASLFAPEDVTTIPASTANNGGTLSNAVPF